MYHYFIFYFIFLVCLYYLNDFKFYNVSLFNNLITKNISLLTVSNHRSVVDDPALFAGNMSLLQLSSTSLFRYGFCAREICFRNKYSNFYFFNGKCLPIDRGLGIYQPDMKLISNYLANKSWVHIFPEGRVVQLADIGPCKWGVGYLLAENPNTTILPFISTGMDEIFKDSRGKVGRYIPQWGQRIRGFFMPTFNVKEYCDKFDKLCKVNDGFSDPWPPNREELYASLTFIVEKELRRGWDGLQILMRVEDYYNDLLKHNNDTSLIHQNQLLSSNNRFAPYWKTLIAEIDLNKAFDGDKMTNKILSLPFVEKDSFEPFSLNLNSRSTLNLYTNIHAKINPPKEYYDFHVKIKIPANTFLSNLTDYSKLCPPSNFMKHFNTLLNEKRNVDFKTYYAAKAR